MKRRIRIVYIGLIVLTACAFILSVCSGSATIPPSRVLAVLTGGEAAEKEVSIIMQLRLPTTLMAFMLGGALGVSGYLLQTFFANPIAGPYILGISSGAKMAVAAVMIVVLGKRGSISGASLVAAAFGGALITTFFIIFVSRKVHHIASLLAAGIMVGYICSAVTDFLVTFAEDQDIVNLHGWSQGSFSGMNWNGVATSAVIVGSAMAATLLLSKPIGAFRMGENYARSMGVNVAACRVMLILLSSLLAACVTAFAGPVSFVGIAVPFLIKGMLGTAKPSAVVPAVFFGGAFFCLMADLIARTALAPTVLNVSTVTSVFGAPVVIFMLMRGKKASG